MPTEVRPAAHVEQGKIPPRAQHRRLFTIWAATLTVLLGLLFTTVTALTVTLWRSDAGYAESTPVVDLGFFALGGILITSGLASQIRTPQRQVAGLQQSILALLALAVAGYLGGRIEPFVGGVVLLAAMAPVVVLHPTRGTLLAAGQSVSRPLAAMAVAALAPALAYASSMLEHARGAGPSCFLGQCVRGDRFAEMAALAVAVVLVALLASLKTAGWVLPAWTAGIAALLVGAASLASPGEVGALEPLWAAAAAVWGATVIVVAHFEARGGAARARGARVDVHGNGR